jgi:hypothetical protein
MCCIAPIETDRKWESTRGRGNFDKQGAKKTRLEANNQEEAYKNQQSLQMEVLKITGRASARQSLCGAMKQQVSSESRNQRHATKMMIQSTM